MTAAIVDALKKLDPTNDAHWTDDGLPRMDVMKELTGNNFTTREAVTTALPGFNRASAGEQTQDGAAQASDAGGATNPPGDGDEAAGGPIAGAGDGIVEGDIGAGQPGTELEQLQAELDRTEAALAELDQRMDELRGTQQRGKAYADGLRDRITNLSPNKPTHAIMGYLESQKQQLAEAAARIDAVNASGLDLKALQDSLAPSKLDGAMANRKRG